jgi:hypothetical protein
VHYPHMGKTEEEQAVAAGVRAEVQNQNAQSHWVWWCCGCCNNGGGLGKLIGLRCIFVLLLSIALLLSALFWLPPFLQFAHQQDLDLDSYKGGFFFFFFFLIFFFWV